jgi:hypothetical protein
LTFYNNSDTITVLKVREEKQKNMRETEINETITELEKGIAEIKGIRKDASLKLSRSMRVLRPLIERLIISMRQALNLSSLTLIGNHTLTPAEKENLWLALEVMEDDLKEELYNINQLDL